MRSVPCRGITCLAASLGLLLSCARSPASTALHHVPEPQAAPAPEPAPADKSSRFVRVALGERTSLLLLDVQSAADEISTRDAFLRNLTLLDRQVRMGVVTELDEADFTDHARAQVRAFEPAQIEKLTKVAAQVGALLDALDLARWLPREIKVVQTTGLEEGFPEAFDLSYTRAGIIYVNTRALQLFSRQLLLHELFHVLATRNEAQREELYAAIGFTKIAPPRFSDAQNLLRMTLPEVPQVPVHAIVVRYAGESVRTVPVVMASKPYDGGTMVDVATSRWAILDADGTVRSMAEIAELEQLLEQVGRNTSSLSGPEELLAENFVLLVLGEPEPRSPEVIERMRAILNAP